MLPYCDVAHVTKIDFAYEADSHFPNLDEDDEWEITGESDEQTYFDLEYQFVKYERKKQKEQSGAGKASDVKEKNIPQNVFKLILRDVFVQ